MNEQHNAPRTSEHPTPSSDEVAAQPPAPQAPGVLGERGVASINSLRSLQSRLSNLLAIGLMVALGVGLLTSYYAHTASRRAHGRQAAQTAARAKAQTDMPLPPLGPIDPPAAVAPAPVAPTLAHLLGPAPPMPAQPLADGQVFVAARVPRTPRPSATQRALLRRLAGPAFSDPGEVGGSVGTGTDAAGDAAPRAMLAGAPVGDTGLDEQASTSARAADTGPMASLLRPSVTAAVRARVLPTQDLLLPKGSFIDCTLETAIDSSLPGLTTCITATDTFSADGRVVLLERGTKLVGETRGIVQQGTSRVFVLWTEARTPTGVVVPLDSPGTDELGRSGLPGAVNRHFFERFGAAMLISVIDGGVQAAVAAHSNGGAVIYNPTSSEDVMTEALKGTVNIAPTVVKQNGDRIEVLVARDLDFRSVYALRPTH
ncbi:MAG: type IV secretion system protein VirB10 [Steroidobacteraceae bacterium]